MAKILQSTFQKLVLALLSVLFVFSCQDDTNTPTSQIIPLTQDQLVAGISPDKLANDKDFISLTLLRSSIRHEVLSELSGMPKDDLEQMRKIFQSNDEELFVKAVQSGKIKSFTMFQVKSSAIIKKLDDTYNIRDRSVSSLTNSFNRAQQIIFERAKKGRSSGEETPWQDFLDCTGYDPGFCNPPTVPAPPERTQAQKYTDCVGTATIAYASALAVCQCCIAPASQANCREVATITFTAASALCTFKFLRGIL